MSVGGLVILLLYVLGSICRSADAGDRLPIVLGGRVRFSRSTSGSHERTQPTGRHMPHLCPHPAELEGVPDPRGDQIVHPSSGVGHSAVPRHH
ncbi:MAG: hypothetical protein ACRDZ5_01480, partial [Acidimicrobiales bacterium]